MLLLNMFNVCDTLRPIIRIIKYGVIPIIQAGIIIILVLFLILDLGKAVAAGKEDEIKSAQKLAIKRVIYAVAVFLVPWMVNVAFSLLTADVDPDANSQSVTALQCYGLERR